MCRHGMARIHMSACAHMHAPHAYAMHHEHGTPLGMSCQWDAAQPGNRQHRQLTDSAALSTLQHNAALSASARPCSNTATESQSLSRANVRIHRQLRANNINEAEQEQAHLDWVGVTAQSKRVHHTVESASRKARQHLALRRAARAAACCHLGHVKRMRRCTRLYCFFITLGRTKGYEPACITISTCQRAKTRKYV